MTRTRTRREVLIGVSSTLLLPAACSQDEIRPTSGTNAAFLHGVASGDPDSRGVVIWTRVSNTVGRTDVRWRVATDVGFQNVVATGEVGTDETRDYTVKVIVEDLTPGREYFYQFDVDGQFSPAGRSKTLPVGHVERLVMAVATCSHYAFGYFNAYDAIANDADIDLVVHLGDYIYEYGRDGYGGDTGSRIGRDHEPPHETLTLSDYRRRLAQYRTDAGSKAMHARHPLVVIWDDHETANNPWMGGAENHQADEGDWETRRKVSLQAFYEWLPIRDPEDSRQRQDYWRHYKFGDLASLITLETRHTGRSLQVSINDYLKDIDSSADAERFVADVVGAQGRRMLSADMEQFLATEVAESVNANRPWRIIGNQSLMARRIAPRLDAPLFGRIRNELGDAARNMLDELSKHGAFGLPLDLDSWNGYPHARESFYRACSDAGARDLLVLAGDSHSFWQNTLRDAAGVSMGVELGSTGVTSPRSLLSLGQEGITAFDLLNAERNEEVAWTEGRYRGFIRLDINHDRAQADFVRVTNVESEEYDVETIRSVNIEKDDDTLRYV